jgi:hypothetical protein
MTGQELFDLIQDTADNGGEHYAPCLRDDMQDNQEWIVAILDKALAANSRLLPTTGPREKIDMARAVDIQQSINRVDSITYPPELLPSPDEGVEAEVVATIRIPSEEEIAATIYDANFVGGIDHGDDWHTDQARSAARAVLSLFKGEGK